MIQLSVLKGFESACTTFQLSRLCKQFSWTKIDHYVVMLVFSLKLLLRFPLFLVGCHELCRMEAFFNAFGLFHPKKMNFVVDEPTTRAIMEYRFKLNRQV